MRHRPAERMRRACTKELFPQEPPSHPSPLPRLLYVIAVLTANVLSSLRRRVMLSASLLSSRDGGSNSGSKDFWSHRISLKPNCPLGRLVLSIRANILSRFLSSVQQDLPGPQLHPALRQALPESLEVPMALHREPPFYPLCLHVAQTVTKQTSIPEKIKLHSIYGILI